MHKIVLIDDDENIITSLEMVLKSSGFDTNSYTDGLIAIEKIRENCPDIILLDIKMPRIDGLEVYNKIRRFSNVPIIFLTSKDSEIDELIGLRLGADDYVRKPFSQKLLIERIKSVLRRNSIKPTNNTSETSDSLKHLAINNETMTCRWRGNKIDLTVTEFSILKSLLSRPGIIKSRDDLINESFKETLKKEDRAIDSHIKRIRKKFLFFDSDFDIIKTIYGIGYKIK